MLQLRLCAFLAALCAIAVARPSAFECGRPAIEPELVDLNILGGRQAVPGSWPWQAGLYLKPSGLIPEDAYGTHFCAGALIDNRTVITAAHCVPLPAQIIRVHLGSHLRSSKEEDEVLVDVANLCSHPGWTDGNIDDIAIVKLAEAVPFGQTISPVCLPPDNDDVTDEDEMYVTGWGYTSSGWDREQSEHLMQARQSLMSKEECEIVSGMNVTKIICASHDLGSSCHGDSGGPLVIQRDGVWQLQGVVSGGPSICGLSFRPMYYTEISKHADWIREYRNSEDPFTTVGLCKEAEFAIGIDEDDDYDDNEVDVDQLLTVGSQGA